MTRHYAALAGSLLFFLGALIGSCKKDEAQPTGSSAGLALTATPPGVTVATNGSQNVRITGGMAPYNAQSQNSNLATAQFVTNADTAVLMITGVSTATGATSVIVRDASSPQQKSVAVGVNKVQ